VFGDYCSGTLWATYQRTAGTWYTYALADTRYRISTFGQGQDGEVYVGHGGGEGAVYRLAGVP
jgi:hypothetical protein